MAGDIHNITISVILYIYYYYRNSIHFQPFDYIIQQKLFWKIGQSYSISLIIYFEAYNIVLLVNDGKIIFYLNTIGHLLSQYTLRT